ncbi:MAG: hypothetical protein ACLFMO_05100 [Eubacteriales bacterium]
MILKLLIVIMLLFLNGCSKYNINYETKKNDNVQETKSQMNSLIEDGKEIEDYLNNRNEEIEEVLNDEGNSQNDNTKQKEEYYEETYYLAEQFIEALLNNDKEVMETLMEDKFYFKNEYLCYDYNGQEIKVSTVEKRDNVYKLSNYEYIEDIDSMFYQFQVEEGGVLNGFFLKLTFKLIDNKWIINNIETDV